MKNPLTVIFEDDCLMVLDKSAGVVVEPTETQTRDTLADILIRDYQNNLDRGGIVHRLDKDTSGILLVAKTQAALENLQAQFKDRVVKKQYIALVHGLIKDDGVIEGAIGRNPGDREKFIVTPDGKEATTQYLVVKTYELAEEKLHKIFEEFSKIQFNKLRTTNYALFTLLRCSPLTGRTHQIRVHLKHIGHPIVGDSKYGGRKTTRLDHRWCPRQFLHAASIEFCHPVTGQVMEFVSPLPEDLQQALSYL
ncbi:hypothetical protein A2631_03790 [Candidatus Daviesbacteria bacterium RIFCSPHIGHO2_01_FULL_44_29]|uniref:Pseudouridine synthase RsuA/RluA-like domain-containing protein n=1 Tax=Candidatus Daviesbacteria bacterium RIFCSPHIGHO2_02_FULL_43_12 TaxID=1797776 RepID=A0A1F5KI32_9BACT|nr:MAG: hypothetical protein A2631_03790 [Candidatus Daviesbacteria bacterium RIFCSPHIGHO2_01_FULL_44_29]OGE39806.1 MAG: hypothetical protein A3E86_04520 [Candidatus Daviesbacteria bacterium RIFCSPHIGHO2_12_FULL_47_45]OGE40480.1 MAG: hypothetical protein A3D25_00250 [Candidatus Daviesbacteria bacterium RIFCSPHIGHO2_02_FULL_43_12]OGE70031.1 MAG: hypothetical protein A3B55_05050 [Candidatus Daviesbacteria bacterium RIFCSPLOWO2_01_FULL_43_15]